MNGPGRTGWTEPDPVFGEQGATSDSTPMTDCRKPVGLVGDLRRRGRSCGGHRLTLDPGALRRRLPLTVRARCSGSLAARRVAPPRATDPTVRWPSSTVDEEGARFGVACAGSRILTGALSPDRPLTDADGTTMADALAAAGRDLASAWIRTSWADRGRSSSCTSSRVPWMMCMPTSGEASDSRPHGCWRIDGARRNTTTQATALDDRRDAMLGFAATPSSLRGEQPRAVATVRRCAPTRTASMPSLRGRHLA